jgi:DNA-directed RNA polymerase specialized sigma24 family protein
MTFDEFAGARLPAVLRFATALTGDPDLAKDLVQEVLIRVSGRWQEIGQLDRPEAYIRKMVVKEFLSWRRRSWRLAELAKLSRRQRTALVLRYYEGFSDAEIAEVMGCTQSTVRGHVFKALAALRVELVQPLATAAPGKETH